MALRARRHGSNGLDAWPGYVDALSTLLMVIIFVLLVFVLAQAFLTATLAGRTETLAKVRDELALLTSAFSLEKEKTSALEGSVARLEDQLRAITANRDVLATERERLAGQVSELNRTVQADKETIAAHLADLARLEEQTRALQALKEELEQAVAASAAATATEQEKHAAALALLESEKSLGDSARAQIALLNKQVAELKAQFAAVQAALGLAEQKAKDKDIEISNLGQRLNAALVRKVEDLEGYRSEFFGRLRKLLASRPGIQIVGDRFVFQSEVLFPVGSADLTPTGISQMADLAASIRDIAKTIPPELPWLLRVDGHTDPQPLKGGAFASNWELSAARAIIVVKLLVAFGVAPEHLAATGFGEFQPFIAGDTPDAYAKDRRIELRLTDR